jgi:hypothetical protein
MSKIDSIRRYRFQGKRCTRNLGQLEELVPATRPATRGTAAVSIRSGIWRPVPGCSRPTPTAAGQLYAADRVPGPIQEAACWVDARRPVFVLADLEAAAPLDRLLRQRPEAFCGELLPRVAERIADRRCLMLAAGAT